MKVCSLFRTLLSIKRLKNDYTNVVLMPILFSRKKSLASKTNVHVQVIIKIFCVVVFYDPLV